MVAAGVMWTPRTGRTPANITRGPRVDGITTPLPGPLTVRGRNLPDYQQIVAGLVPDGLASAGILAQASIPAQRNAGTTTPPIRISPYAFSYARCAPTQSGTASSATIS